MTADKAVFQTDFPNSLMNTGFYAAYVSEKTARFQDVFHDRQICVVFSDRSAEENVVAF